MEPSPASLMVSQSEPENVSSPLLIFSNSFSSELEMKGAFPHNLRGQRVLSLSVVQVRETVGDVLMYRVRVDWTVGDVLMYSVRVDWTYNMYMITPMLHTSHC